MLKMLKMGREMGFEPMHIGTTIRGLNHLTTPAINSVILFYQKQSKNQVLFITNLLYLNIHKKNWSTKCGTPVNL